MSFTERMQAGRDAAAARRARGEPAGKSRWKAPTMAQKRASEAAAFSDGPSGEWAKSVHRARALWLIAKAHAEHRLADDLEVIRFGSDLNGRRVVFSIEETF
jgi:hypothetical protein